MSAQMVLGSLISSTICIFEDLFVVTFAISEISRPQSDLVRGELFVGKLNFVIADLFVQGQM